MADGPTAATGSADSRVMDFGSVFFDSQVKDGEVALPARLAEGTQPPGFNVAEILGTEILRNDLTIMMPFLLLNHLLFLRRGGYILPRTPH